MKVLKRSGAVYVKVKVCTRRLLVYRAKGAPIGQGIRSLCKSSDVVETWVVLGADTRSTQREQRSVLRLIAS
jgi:hypothetical protein